MLDERDLQAIAQLIDSKLQESEQRTVQLIDSKLQESEQRTAQPVSYTHLTLPTILLV